MSALVSLDAYVQALPRAPAHAADGTVAARSTAVCDASHAPPVTRGLDPERWWQERRTWQRQVLTDPELSDKAKTVASFLLFYLNEESGDAWPSQETLAAQLHTTLRTINSAIRQLKKRGHLKALHVERKRACRYQPRILVGAANDDLTACITGSEGAVPARTAPPQSDCVTRDRKNSSCDGLQHTKNSSCDESRDTKNCAPIQEENFVLTLINNPIPPYSPPTGFEAAFAELQATYPSSDYTTAENVAKAERAFREVWDRDPAQCQTLIARAAEYRREVRRRERSYVKSLCSWLRDETRVAGRLRAAQVKHTDASPSPGAGATFDQPDIRQAFLDAGFDGGFVRSYLDRATWISEQRMIRTATATAADRLRRDAPRLLASLGVRVAGPQAA